MECNIGNGNNKAAQCLDAEQARPMLRLTWQGKQWDLNCMCKKK